MGVALLSAMAGKAVHNRPEGNVTLFHHLLEKVFARNPCRALPAGWKGACEGFQRAQLLFYVGFHHSWPTINRNEPSK